MQSLVKAIRCGLVPALLFGAASASFGQAAPYPSKPIRIIVAYSPGTASETVARAAAHELAKQLGVSVVIENREGAGGNIGHTAAAKAAPDGYTLLLGTTWISLTSHSTSPPAYDAVKDFVPILRIGSVPMLVVAGSQSENKTWAELVARSKTTDLNFGTTGKGGASHVLTEIMKKDFGMRGQDVPYKNTGQAMMDVSTNKLDFYMGNVPPARGLIQAGQLLPLAVGSKQRNPMFPNTPTLAELSGRPDYEMVVWYGVFAPAGTPPDIVARLQREFMKASDTQQMRTTLADGAGTLELATGEELGKQVRADNARFGRIVKDMGLTPGS
ncbi:tripartite tricarboxylate transporter substrate binding protein [soil metagenome]